MFFGTHGVRRLTAFIVAVLGSLLAACSSRSDAKQPGGPVEASPEVGVVRVVRKTLQRSLVVSSELVPGSRRSSTSMIGPLA